MSGVPRFNPLQSVQFWIALETMTETEEILLCDRPTPRSARSITWNAP
jgi:hypothetical protein